ncbi:MAG: ribosome-associated translation inhibitor RaiA [Pseudomonadota bacterium]|nr:ribosome-associated translation inhibitor RaiA [Pseudomonadota bacterium]MDQ3160670.1 ribosome-associated translation inhibitor RaiA [Pseudomonadota bacterium]
MQIETHGHQMEVTPALRDYVETHLARLSRHFDHPCEIQVQLGLDKPEHRAEATITLVGRAPMHATANGVDMYAAIDLLSDKLDRLLMKHKERMTDHHRGESIARDGTLG